MNLCITNIKVKDRQYLLDIYRGVESSKFDVLMGLHFEEAIKNTVKEIDYPCEKGKVVLVDNKEVDVVIPNRDHPKILVMVSYSLTTSSSQTTIANEQSKKYDKINEYRISRTGRDVIF